MEQNYYIVIPAPVYLDRRLSYSAMILYGQISSLCNSNGYCWATNSYFSKINDVSKNTISTLISKLEECGHIASELQRDENNAVIARNLKIAIPVQFSLKAPIQGTLEENSKLLNTKEYTTMSQPPVAPKKVDFANPRSELQAFMIDYLRKCAPSIYEAAEPKQVGGFFRQYGTMFSKMLGTAGNVDVARLALDEAISFFGKKGYTWGLKALSTNWEQFVCQAMEKQKRI